MERVLLGALVLAVAVFVPTSARTAECSVLIATTPTGTTFPCTVCVEGGRPISITCTPPVAAK